MKRIFAHLLIALGTLGIAVGPLIALMSVAGVGVGLAMQGVLSNLVAGLLRDGLPGPGDASRHDGAAGGHACPGQLEDRGEGLPALPH